MPLALAALTMAALLLPSAAQAGTSSATMTLSSNLFPSGAPAPDGLSGTVRVATGSPLTLKAPKYLYEPGPPPAVYEFIFWDVNAALGRKLTATVSVPSTETAFQASAWYLPVGGGGPGTPGVTTWAFSLNQQKVLSASPIASVSPAGAQTGPTTVSTTDALAITARKVKLTAEKLIGGYGLFTSWFQFSGSGKIAGSRLTVRANRSSDSIGFYGIPVPDPCQTYRDQLAGLSPADFPTIAVYQAAVHALAGELTGCEKHYGELAPTP